MTGDETAVFNPRAYLHYRRYRHGRRLVLDHAKLTTDNAKLTTDFRIALDRGTRLAKERDEMEASTLNDVQKMTVMWFEVQNEQKMLYERLRGQNKFHPTH